MQRPESTCHVVKTSLAIAVFAYKMYIFQIALTKRATAASLGNSATPVPVRGRMRIVLFSVDLVLQRKSFLDCRP